ncbi:hypothetical protein C8F04DRAFT_1181938 [Mycena alexandri]|uniref:Uncharacterized protein n=1 Tax=Mycena alexandri TaxID=1745969 RepID=A0AAD6SYB9_9AGAR|nr:hypothetical protein C8F04DRAFT_1181938 [Mycena alexandri]
MPSIPQDIISDTLRFLVDTPGHVWQYPAQSYIRQTISLGDGQDGFTTLLVGIPSLGPVASSKRRGKDSNCASGLNFAQRTGARVSEVNLLTAMTRARSESDDGQDIGGKGIISMRSIVQHVQPLRGRKWSITGVQWCTARAGTQLATTSQFPIQTAKREHDLAAHSIHIRTIHFGSPYSLVYFPAAVSDPFPLMSHPTQGPIVHSVSWNLAIEVAQSCRMPMISWWIDGMVAKENSSWIRTPDQAIKLGLALPPTSESSTFFINQKFLFSESKNKVLGVQNRDRGYTPRSLFSSR